MSIAPATPAVPDPSPDATASAIAALADAAGQASLSLYDYGRNHPAANDAAHALQLAQSLDQQSDDLRAQAVTLLGAQAAAAVQQLQDAVKSIGAFQQGVKVGAARLDVAAALVTLAGAAALGDVGGILKGAVGVRTALKAESAAKKASA